MKNLATNSQQNQPLTGSLITYFFYGCLRAHRVTVVLFCVLIAVLPATVQSASKKTVKKTDLRILIDVSGSMKKNDPQNLRAPSVRLLIGLIPNGTKAGIWTFAKYVNMQVKYGLVNKKWKKNARKEAGKIHSRGLYTNIEAVLKRSSSDWNKKDPTTNRHIILLTDGVVDISKKPEINLKSRNKVINYYLPRLKKAGVKIHTIALSQQADHELLKLLSVSTDGWYELIEDPNKLHRVFLRIFEKSTSANAVPLENNFFKVDKSIRDMTVLSFNTKGTSSKLISPSKKIISEKNKPDTVSWFHEQGYDLITITKPEVGDWKLDAPVDKDNRVLVVTNLTLLVDDLPNNVLLNQRILLKAELRQKNKSIKNLNFLKLVKVQATKKSLNEPELKIFLRDDGTKLDKKANDGIYFNELRSPLRSGIFEILISAQGPTFKRQKQYVVNVFNGLAEIEIKDEKDNKPFFIEVKPHLGLLQKNSVDISYRINEGEKQKLSEDVKNVWKLQLAAEHAGKKLTFVVSGIRQNNNSVEMQMERILPERVKKIKPKPVKSNPEKSVVKKTEETEKDGWFSVVIWVLIINITLIFIGAIIYVVLKKIRTKVELEDEEALQL